MKKAYSINKVTELENSEVEWEGEVDASLLEEKFNESLSKIATETELPGFRKGKAPADLVLKKVGEFAILEDAAEMALDSVYAPMIEELKIRIVGRPKVLLTKVARNNPLGFKITIAVIPKLNLPNYSSIAKKEMAEPSETEVTNEEVEKILLEIRKNQFHSEQHKNGTWKDHDHGEIKEEDLPPLDDAQAKKLGAFESVEDMKSKVREHTEKEKVARAKGKKRTAIIEKIIEETKFDAPQVLIDSELDSMLSQFENDITQSGLTLDAYLEHIQKSIDDLRNEWKETATKKAKAQIILSAIAEKEKISADTELIRKETEKLLVLYPSADPIQARGYVSMHLTNEKVFAFLENN
jgi:FKBP-type peptidyl-prolyl cis-trans isomerase (trigger factor)